MIAAISDALVEDLGGKGFIAVRGISMLPILNLQTIAVQKKPKFWKFWKNKKYIISKFKVSDICNESDAPFNVEEIKREVTEYQKKKDVKVEAGGKIAVEVLNEVLGIKTDALAARKITLKIKTTGLRVCALNENSFYKELQSRTLNKEHPFVIACTKNRRGRMCVVNQVLENSTDLVFEWSKNQDITGGLSVEVSGTSGSVHTDASSDTMNTVNIPAGTVLACSFGFIEFDIDTGRISLVYDLNSTKHSDGEIIMLAGRPRFDQEEYNSLSSFREFQNCFDNMTDSDRQIVKKFVSNMINSPTDIASLAAVFDSHGSRMTLEELENLTGIAAQSAPSSSENDKTVSFRSDTNPTIAIAAVVEAMSELNIGDLENLRKCTDDQIKQILHLVLDDKSLTPMETSYMDDEQKVLFKAILAMMNFEVNFDTGMMATDVRERPLLECVACILYCLKD